MPDGLVKPLSTLLYLLSEIYYIMFQDGIFIEECFGPSPQVPRLNLQGLS